MVVVGLTGGIGSGKTTVARLLVERGGALVDADQVARQVVEPGTVVLAALVERFGEGIVQPDGHLDRPALATVAFADEGARRDLNRITHPAIRMEMVRQASAIGAADPDAVVVLDVPLLAEVGRHRYPLDGVVVVEVPVDLAIERLVAGRGYRADEARARMAAQATAAQRRAMADVVIDNSGGLEHLAAEVDRAWRWIQGLRPRP